MSSPLFIKMLFVFIYIMLYNNFIDLFLKMTTLIKEDNNQINEDKPDIVNQSNENTKVYNENTSENLKTDNSLNAIKLSSKAITRLCAIQALYIHLLHEKDIITTKDFVRQYLNDIYGFKKNTEIDKDFYLTYKINRTMLDTLTNYFQENYKTNQATIDKYLYISSTKLSPIFIAAFHTAINEQKSLKTHSSILMQVYVDIIASFGFSKSEIDLFHAILDLILKET